MMCDNCIHKDVCENYRIADPEVMAHCKHYKGFITARSDINKLLNKINEEFEHQERIIDDLRKENNSLKDEHYKDKQLQIMETRLTTLKQELHRGFHLSEKEAIAATAWMQKHNQEEHNNTSGGAIGGRYSYCFTPTSIGIIGTIRCSCGAEFTFQEI